MWLIVVKVMLALICMLEETLQFEHVSLVRHDIGNVGRFVLGKFESLSSGVVEGSCLANWEVKLCLHLGLATLKVDCV